MQELVLSTDQLMQFIGQYLWPFLRIGAVFMAAPIFGAKTVTARVRVLLALFVTLLVSPMIEVPRGVDLLSGPALMIVANEVLIGLALGFSFQVVLHIFVLAGQLIAMKMGLGFASMNDPSNGITVTVLSQFYLLLSTVLFLIFDGHLLIIALIVESFSTFPVGGAGFGPDQFIQIANMGSWMFSAALVVVLPLFTAMLVINMAFGIMNRSAPQINVFSVGFPITLIFGLLFMWLSLIVFLPYFEDVFYQAGMFSRALLRLP
ncbi:flagellar biosynthetic protein FliR [Gilvimarinus agarilyticus]|uniref:flagellar biosynthetic protein FliR n=1 Tax=unclassified Gilvimarinus TaxID=2642066 RepID=UPI001C0A1ADA|nr:MULTISPECIES: flagellar biosynthetic protein FliR [unclassified Gilvimarinus]MBU2887223.1 flagellar biosynthetic protein FliR [Gilvimarinus agarilyticus]MDO6571882.1 flagellar biosynthetic protein FliR [Gilvimarinus sp. 2_MG-2023]MDO6745951.1 flagellar biosynthetic protein FliR [Gilvimarinus sp. 1_MG-2023]